MGLGERRQRVSGRDLDLLGRVEGQDRSLGLGTAVGVSRRVSRQAVRARPHPVVEDRGDELTDLVDRARSHAGRRDRTQLILDLTRRHLTRRSITESSHDHTARHASTAAVGSPEIGEEQTMVAERRGFGILDLLEPPQILDGQLPEGDAPPAALLAVTLEQCPVSVVLTDQRQHPLSSLRLSQHSVRRTATLQAPATVAIGLSPGTPKSSDDGLAVTRPLAVPERSGRSLANERASTRIGGHRTTQETPRIGRNCAGQRSGNGLAGQRPRATFSVRIPARTAFLATQIARNHGNHTFFSGLSRRRSRVRVPSLPLFAVPVGRWRSGQSPRSRRHGERAGDRAHRAALRAM